MLTNGEISKMYLSGTDLGSEYQSCMSPAFLTTPGRRFTGDFNLTSVKPNQPPCPPLPSPASPSQKTMLLCVERGVARVIPTPPSPYAITNFTSWMFLQCVYYFPTLLLSPLSSHYGLVTRLFWVSWLVFLPHTLVSFQSVSVSQ